MLKTIGGIFHLLSGEMTDEQHTRSSSSSSVAATSLLVLVSRPLSARR
ncbi:hypothetical protein [Nitrincola sp. MINF-07-Sa-05]